MSEQGAGVDGPKGRQPNAGGVVRFLRRLAKVVGGVFAALVLAILLVVVFGIPIELNWVKGKIEAVAGEALGRSFAIEGPLTVVPSFPPAAQIEGIVIGNPQGWPDAELARLELAHMELRILPLLRGEILIEEAAIEGLHVNLETNSDGEPNWLLKKKTRKAESEPEAKGEPAALEFIELAELSLRDIVLKHHDAATGKDFELAIEEIAGSAEDREPMRLEVRGKIQDIPYEVEVNAGSLATLVGGEAAWRVDFEAKAVGATLAATGEIAEPLRGRGLALTVDFAGPNMKDLEAILETRLPPIQSFALKGRIEEAGGKYRIADLEGEIAATGLTGSFEADTSGDKPCLLGNVDILRIDAGPLFTAIGEDEGAAPPDAEQTQTPADEAAADDAALAGEDEPSKPSEKLDLDEPVLALDVLGKFDAQFELTVHEVINAPSSLRDATLEVTVADGRLSSPVAVTLAEVPFKGELNLASEAGTPTVAVSLSSEKSDIGELAAWLTGAQGIEGRFELVRLGLSSSGESVRSLVETSELTLGVTGASLSHGHDTGGRPVEFSLAEADVRFPAADESRIAAEGSLLGEAFVLELRGGTFIENFIQKRWPVQLTATGAGAELTVDGTLRRVERLAGTEIEVSLKGDRIGGLAAWLGVSAAAEHAYVLAGKVSHTEARIRVQIDEVRIGNSAFSGEGGIRREDDTPVTFADLDFQVLDLKGLGGLVPEKSETKTTDSGPRGSGPEALRIDVPILPKGIEIFDSDIDIAIARIKLDPADITDVSLSSQIRDGYVERAPIGAVVAGTRFDGGFGIDLRGDVPKIDLEVQSSKSDVGALMSQLGVIDGLAVTAGGFDLDIALEGASTREMLERSRLLVGITDGAWDFRAPGAEEALSIRIPKAAVSAEPGQPITLAIDGLIDQTPLKIEITTDPLGSFAVPKERLKLNLGVALAKADIKLIGAAPMPVQADNIHFAMEFAGHRLSDFDELLDVDLPPIGPYRLQGGFGSRSTGFYVKDLQLTVGESTLTGKLDLKTVRKPPRLDIDLVAKRI